MKAFGRFSLKAYVVPCCGLVLFLLGSCATAGPQKEASFEKEMQTQMAKCTEKYGYDPDKVQGLGEHQLGPHEREWRACLYEAIRTFIIPKTPVPDMYINLIAQDRSATDTIVAGKMTRSQRKQKNVALLIEIREKEEAIGTQKTSQKQEEVRATMKEKTELDMRREPRINAQDSLMKGMGR